MDSQQSRKRRTVAIIAAAGLACLAIALPVSGAFAEGDGGGRQHRGRSRGTAGRPLRPGPRAGRAWRSARGSAVAGPPPARRSRAATTAPTPPHRATPSRCKGPRSRPTSGVGRLLRPSRLDADGDRPDQPIADRARLAPPQAHQAARARLAVDAVVAVAQPRAAAPVVGRQPHDAVVDRLVEEQLAGVRRAAAPVLATGRPSTDVGLEVDVDRTALVPPRGRPVRNWATPFAPVSCTPRRYVSPAVPSWAKPE